MKVVILLVAVLCTVHARVDYGRCYTRAGRQGKFVECPSGYVGIKLCTSNKSANCGGSFTRITCCKKLTTSTASRHCKLYAGRYGSHLACASNQATAAVCSSGHHSDCGYGIWNRIMCCNADLASSSTCNWVYGYYGFDVACGHNQVIAGVCSSGKNADCNQGGRKYYTGIRCCSAN